MTFQGKQQQQRQYNQRERLNHLEHHQNHDRRATFEAGGSSRSRLIVHVILALLAALALLGLLWRTRAEPADGQRRRLVATSPAARNPSRRSAQPEREQQGRGALEELAAVDASGGDDDSVELVSKDIYLYAPRSDELQLRPAPAPPSTGAEAGQFVTEANGGGGIVAAVTNSALTLTSQTDPSAGARPAPPPPPQSPPPPEPGLGRASGGGGGLEQPATITPTSSRSNDPSGGGVSASPSSGKSATKSAGKSAAKSSDAGEQTEANANVGDSDVDEKMVANHRRSNYCLGTKDSEAALHWLCQGARLIKVPTDLRPQPMSL